MPATSSKRSLLVKLGIPVLGVAAIAGAFFAAAAAEGRSAAARHRPAQQRSSRPINRPGFAGEDFSALAKRLMPSVVNISTRQTVARGDGLPAYRPQFARSTSSTTCSDAARAACAASPRSARASSSTRPAMSSPTTTSSRAPTRSTSSCRTARCFPPSWSARDEDVDLALLKVESRTPLTPVPWANSDTAEVGQWVVAIGNPFGLGGTVTAGIISARNRDISAGSYDDFIQTDAAINKGNSGGPLFNLRGEVVGINTAIISPGEAGGSVGVGFSVPANFAKVVIQQLRAVRRRPAAARWASLPARSTRRIAEAYGLKTPQGAIVTSVAKGGAAEAAGLKQGDLITALNNQQIKESRDLFRIMGVTQVGAQVSVRYLRNGKQGAATVKLTVGATAAAAKPRRQGRRHGAHQHPRHQVQGDRGRATAAAAASPPPCAACWCNRSRPARTRSARSRSARSSRKCTSSRCRRPNRPSPPLKPPRRAGKPVLLQLWGEDEVSYVAVRAR